MGVRTFLMGVEIFEHALFMSLIDRDLSLVANSMAEFLVSMTFMNIITDSPIFSAEPSSVYLMFFL